jgi:membrane protease YdiL (CAAX protease family)
MVRLAIVFYAACAAVAVVISALSGIELKLGAEPLVASLLAGLLTAAGTVLLGTIAYRLIPLVRQLADEVAPLLMEGSSTGGLVFVSLLSGVGEEMLFRGALQPLVGLVLSALLFGALHVGPDRRYLLWTAWAVLAGLLFGLLYRWTGGLLAPVVAHAVHNAVTLVLWRRRWMLGKAVEPGGIA